MKIRGVLCARLLRSSGAAHSTASGAWCGFAVFVAIGVLTALWRLCCLLLVLCACVCARVYLHLVTDDPVSAINAHLPADVRIFGALKSTEGFDARSACSSRRYEYLLPTYALRPRVRPPEPQTLAASYERDSRTALSSTRALTRHGEGVSRVTCSPGLPARPT